MSGVPHGMAEAHSGTWELLPGPVGPAWGWPICPTGLGANPA